MNANKNPNEQANETAMPSKLIFWLIENTSLSSDVSKKLDFDVLMKPATKETMGIEIAAAITWENDKAKS